MFFTLRDQLVAQQKYLQRKLATKQRCTTSCEILHIVFRRLKVNCNRNTMLLKAKFVKKVHLNRLETLNPPTLSCQVCVCWGEFITRRCHASGVLNLKPENKLFLKKEENGERRRYSKKRKSSPAYSQRQSRRDGREWF